jgi:hypothetical protein
MDAGKTTFASSEAVAEEAALAKICDAVNASADIRAMEQDFDAISADIAEPWTDAAMR